jgi:myo-inositol-hexaphosphate 3-phosphohydrolase
MAVGYELYVRNVMFKCLFGQRYIKQEFANVYGYEMVCERCGKIKATIIPKIDGDVIDKPGFSHGPIGSNTINRSINKTNTACGCVYVDELGIVYNAEPNIDIWAEGTGLL